MNYCLTGLVIQTNKVYMTPSFLSEYTIKLTTRLVQKFKIRLEYLPFKEYFENCFSDLIPYKMKRF